MRSIGKRVGDTIRSLRIRAAAKRALDSRAIKTDLLRITAVGCDLVRFDHLRRFLEEHNLAAFRDLVRDALGCRDYMPRRSAIIIGTADVLERFPERARQLHAAFRGPALWSPRVNLIFAFPSWNRPGSLVKQLGLSWILEAPGGWMLPPAIAEGVALALSHRFDGSASGPIDADIVQYRRALAYGAEAWPTLGKLLATPYQVMLHPAYQQFWQGLGPYFYPFLAMSREVALFILESKALAERFPLRRLWNADYFEGYTPIARLAAACGLNEGELEDAFAAHLRDAIGDHATDVISS